MSRGLCAVGLCSGVIMCRGTMCEQGLMILFPKVSTFECHAVQIIRRNRSSANDFAFSPFRLSVA